MPPGILLLLLVAAVLHAIWNILLKSADDPLRTAGRGMLIGAGFLAPIALVVWFGAGRPAIPDAAWRLAVVSGVLEAAYFVFLSAAYKRGDLSLVYPIARGTAPVLSVAVGVLILGERLGPAGWIGVSVLLAAILALQQPWSFLRRGGQMPRHVREAVAFALLTGVTITSYSAVDRDGARLVDPLFYAAMLWTFTTVFLLGWIGLLIQRDRRDLRRALAQGATALLPTALGRTWLRAGVGGVVTVVAYLLVLVAYRYAPLTAVAPLRESAIVIISGWGSFRLKEARGRRDATIRIGLAVVIVIGALLLASEG